MIPTFNHLNSFTITQFYYGNRQIAISNYKRFKRINDK